MVCRVPNPDKPEISTLTADATHLNEAAFSFLAIKNTEMTSKVLKNCYNAVDRNFYDAIKVIFSSGPWRPHSCKNDIPALMPPDTPA